MKAVDGRIVDFQFHEKTVQLRFRQRIGTFHFEWILRRQYKKRGIELMSCLSDGDAALFHRFEQCRLRFRRRTVDFVRKHDVGEDRPGVEFESVRGSVVDRNSQDVRRKRVARELDPAKLEREAPPDRSSKGGFADPGYVFDEDMASRKKRCERQLDRSRVAPKDEPYILPKPLECRRRRRFHADIMNKKLRAF